MSLWSKISVKNLPSLYRRRTETEMVQREAKGLIYMPSIGELDLPLVAGGYTLVPVVRFLFPSRSISA